MALKARDEQGSKSLSDCTNIEMNLTSSLMPELTLFNRSSCSTQFSNSSTTVTFRTAVHHESTSEAAYISSTYLVPSLGQQ